MNGKVTQKRMNEFVWYHIHGDGDSNGQTLRAYAKAEKLDTQGCFDLAYFYAITYCCVSAVYLLQHREEIGTEPADFGEKHKGSLVFQSDRKYVSYKDRFAKVLGTWSDKLAGRAEEFEKTVCCQDGTVNTEKAIEAALSWWFFSRYSAYLFVETYCDITGKSATRVSGGAYANDRMLFEGGVFRAFGKDIEAEYVRKHRRLPVGITIFEEMIHTIQNRVRNAGGDDSLVKLETSLCAYEKFFEGRRYNGFYADRMLEDIRRSETNPEYRQACNAVMQARRAAINPAYLGEMMGWTGIRKAEKQRYKKTGKIKGCPI